MFSSFLLSEFLLFSPSFYYSEFLLFPNNPENNPYFGYSSALLLSCSFLLLLANKEVFSCSLLLLLNRLLNKGLASSIFLLLLKRPEVAPVFNLTSVILKPPPSVFFVSVVEDC